MIKKPDRNAERKVRHYRVRKKISGTAGRPRLNVYRSLSHIYAQVIDDVAGHTLAAASSVEAEVREKCKDLNKVEQAKLIGKLAAERALEKGVKEVVFDRGGYLYTGRVASLAEGAREAGLKF
ncbi:MAG: 50S ribosomal protein L18 [Christensenellales bacterium]|jgi:large subunit ribosomal protein L18